VITILGQKTGALDIRVFDQSMPGDVLMEVIQLAKDCNIGEPFDRTCDLVYLWVIDNKIVGVAAFKRYEFSPTNVVPRMEHIFGPKHVQKTMRGVKFLLSCIADIKERGYKQVWCYIAPEKQYMKVLADKFGFKSYAKDDSGEFFIKDL